MFKSSKTCFYTYRIHTYASCDGSDKPVHLHRLVGALAVRIHKPKSRLVRYRSKYGLLVPLGSCLCIITEWLHMYAISTKVDKVRSGNTTITNCRQPLGTARKSRSTITRHQEDKLSKATSSLFPIKMIAILERT